MTKLTSTQTRSAFAMAWGFAREAAARLGGSARAFWQDALCQAYAKLRKPALTRKEIAKTLDMYADRAWRSTPATSKQVWFLAGLLEQTGGSPYDVINRDMLTKSYASLMIDMCQRDLARAA
ncbi:hypothetical protein GCM10008171_33240 [Methylopila jiangsuensis]|uniref:Uncharacterized protein n=1 Tax=Methylopila jiangsuensis TaxID=586230 RepID=A0A9W6N556_9HYPH|nr:hypothetical protein [Methylopila jiangsuensis]MDR6284541.1 phosphoglycolate phosphatase-like HAD superfamily hydrolase [Methylopila jiangsuensis]GLK78070.1 hypothetical protein GCM10008171_33240 [Methylopila jiangsuensis]